MPNGRNKWNTQRPIGTNVIARFDTEGSDAQGRQSQVIRDEYPTRIEEVNSQLFFLGWAELGASESAPRWKIRRIQLLNGIWEQKYAGGEEVYRYRWDDRAVLPYL